MCSRPTRAPSLKKHEREDEPRRDGSRCFVSRRAAPAPAESSAGIAQTDYSRCLSLGARAPAMFARMDEIDVTSFRVFARVMSGGFRWRLSFGEAGCCLWLPLSFSLKTHTHLLSLPSSSVHCFFRPVLARRRPSLCAVAILLAAPSDCSKVKSLKQ